LPNTYYSVCDLVEKLRNDTPPSPLQGDPDGYSWIDYRDFLPESYEWINCGIDQPGGRLLPGIYTPYLYRGQTERHSPCYPNAYRGFGEADRPRKLSEKLRTKYLASLIKCHWYASLLQKHPAIFYARKMGIQLNFLALAQHYELPTHYIDLTQSIEVAAFFACCYPINNKWIPKKTGEGIIYRFCFARLPEAWKMIELVGLTTLPRPGEQKAWVAPMNLGGDFEKVPYVEKFIFMHDIKSSRYILNMFKDGSTLFPEDPAANIAKAIYVSKKVPTNSVVRILLQSGCNQDGLEKTFNEIQKRLLRYCGLKVQDSVNIDFSKKQLNMLDNYWKEREKDFLKKCGVHAVKIFKKEEQLTRAEAMRLLKINSNTLRKMIQNNKLKAIKVFEI